VTERPDRVCLLTGDDPTTEGNEQDEREAEELARSASGRSGMVLLVCY
jgi:hypothetical protein